MGLTLDPEMTFGNKRKNPEWENYKHAIDFVYVDNWSHVDFRDSTNSE